MKTLKISSDNFRDILNEDKLTHLSLKSRALLFGAINAYVMRVYPKTHVGTQFEKLLKEMSNHQLVLDGQRMKLVDDEGFCRIEEDKDADEFKTGFPIYIRGGSNENPIQFEILLTTGTIIQAYAEYEFGPNTNLFWWTLGDKKIEPDKVFGWRKPLE